MSYQRVVVYLLGGAYEGTLPDESKGTGLDKGAQMHQRKIDEFD
jgi:hypothetical protein